MTGGESATILGYAAFARAPNPIAHLWGQWADTVLRGVT